MGRERRRWTIGEDSLLREAIRKVFEVLQSNVSDINTAANLAGRPLLWRELAKSVPGRTNKDCRRRWCNKLADGTTKGSWTESEDERLSHAVRQNGPKWTQIAAAVGTRNSDQCSSHWSLSLNPDIDYSDWTRVEDEKLLQAVQEHGTNWTMIAATSLPNRTTLALKNRYSALRTKVSQLQGKAKPQPLSGAGTSGVHTNSQCSANAFGPGHLRAQEGNNQSQDDEYEHDYDDEGEQGADEEDRDDVDDEMHDSVASLERVSQEPSPAHAASSHTRFSHPSSQAIPYHLPPLTTTEQNLNTIPVSMGQWSEGLHGPSSYPAMFPPGTAPYTYQDYSAFKPPLADMELNFSAFPNFGLPGCPAQIYDAGLSQEPSIETSLPTSSTMCDVAMSGASHAAPTHTSLPTTASHDKNVQACQRGSRPGSAGQAGHSQSGYPDMANKGPMTPEDVTQAIAQAWCMRSPSDPLSTYTDISSSSEGLQASVHRVSVDAECTPDELGNLMRTLVGATRKMTVKVLS
ncbi:MAG: hypothetical protein LQ344_004705 [Seirophora lacunosa]|nr:MAG: hypothetical protein LQ344_004705 [Seirophora lacunosa]